MGMREGSGKQWIVLEIRGLCERPDMSGIAGNNNQAVKHVDSH